MHSKRTIFSVLAVIATIAGIALSACAQNKTPSTISSKNAMEQFSCSNFDPNLTFEYPVFPGWEPTEKKPKATQCVIFLSDSRLKAAGVQTEIAPQIVIDRLYYGGVPGEMTAPAHLTQQNKNGIFYRQKENEASFWIGDSELTIKLESVMDEYGFSQKTFWQTVIDSFNFKQLK